MDVAASVVAACRAKDEEIASLRVALRRADNHAAQLAALREQAVAIDSALQARRRSEASAVTAAHSESAAARRRAAQLEGELQRVSTANARLKSVASERAARLERHEAEAARKQAEAARTIASGAAALLAEREARARAEAERATVWVHACYAGKKRNGTRAHTPVRMTPAHPFLTHAEHRVPPMLGQSLLRRVQHWRRRSWRWRVSRSL